MVGVTLSTLFLLMISVTALSKLTSDAPVAIPRNSITTPSFTHPSTLALGQVLIASVFKVAAAF